MSRYIDANKFAKQVYEVAYPIVHDINSHERGLTLMDIAKLLYDQPTADVVPMDFHDRCMEIEIQKRMNMVEVVRCKDCEHGQSYNMFGSRYCLKHNDVAVRDNDFCSYGER